ncbi:MAG: GNAT family N-acetyltransferase [Chloroflexota bacterium]|nr:GNAT family N-acetyltransferase [Chloroflexota bacterium]
MNVTIRPMHRGERGRFLERVVETSWNDLPTYLRERVTTEEIAPNVERVVEVLLAQGENVILIADLPNRPNIGQVWLGETRDPYTGRSRGYIYDLYVEAEARGQGVATALLEAAEQASRARGDTELGLTVAAHNQAALSLYRAHGFETERLSLSKPLEK